MIKAPNYKKDAVISTRGWHHPITHELLASRKFTQAQVDEYNGLEKEEIKEKSQPEPTKSTGPQREEYSNLKKDDLVEYAEDFNVDTKGKTKAEIIEELEAIEDADE